MNRREAGGFGSRARGETGAAPSEERRGKKPGADIAGVVSFHGGLDSPTPADGKNIKARVLVLHGADDPYESAQDIAAFQQELRDAKVDWQMVYYSGAVHAFTQKMAGNDPTKGAACDERADRRSWQAMRDFFAEIFR